MNTEKNSLNFFIIFYKEKINPMSIKTPMWQKNDKKYKAKGIAKYINAP